MTDDNRLKERTFEDENLEGQNLEDQNLEDKNLEGQNLGDKNLEYQTFDPQTLEARLSARFLVITAPPKNVLSDPTYKISDFSHLFSDENFATHGKALFFTYIEAKDLTYKCSELADSFKGDSELYPSIIVVGECATGDFKTILNTALFGPPLVRGGINLDDDIKYRKVRITQAEFKNFNAQKLQTSDPKKSKAFGILGNPSTWLTGAFISLAIAVAFIGLAPAAIIGWAALMGVASAAIVVALPLLIIFPAWVIWNDFKAEKIKDILATHAMFGQIGKPDMPPELVALSVETAVRAQHKLLYAYTAEEYLSALPKRLLDWLRLNKKQIVLVSLGIIVSIVILALLVALPGVGPVAAASGFLGTLLSTGFSAIGVSVPVLGGIMAGLAQASGIIAMVLLTLAPLLVADTARRIVSTVEEKVEEEVSDAEDDEPKQGDYPSHGSGTDHEISLSQPEPLVSGQPVSTARSHIDSQLIPPSTRPHPDFASMQASEKIPTTAPRSSVFTPPQDSSDSEEEDITNDGDNNASPRHSSSSSSSSDS